MENPLQRVVRNVLHSPCSYGLVDCSYMGYPFEAHKSGIIEGSTYLEGGELEFTGFQLLISKLDLPIGVKPVKGKSIIVEGSSYRIHRVKTLTGDSGWFLDIGNRDRGIGDD